ncbi:MAG: hypothetical protein VYA84_10820 [Planctomycetota bacterium]|nr:hypothetical protein [Planctomycetota bacterium]
MSHGTTIYDVNVDATADYHCQWDPPAREGWKNYYRLFTLSVPLLRPRGDWDQLNFLTTFAPQN